MQFQSPGTTIFSLGPLTIRWYGLMFAVGFLCSTYFAVRLAKRWRLDSEQIVNLALSCFLGGIVGSRLYYVALSWSEFSIHPENIAAIWKGGMSIHGGIIASILVAVWYCRYAKLQFWRCIDLLASVLPLGQAIGRWGNFFNSEAFGRPVSDDFPLKLFIPFEQRPAHLCNFDYFHPTFLYESLWDLWLFIVLYFFVVERLKKYPGLTFFIYLMAYSIGRFLIEPMRIDSIMMFGMPAPSIVSAIGFGIAMIGLLVLLKKYRSAPAANTQDNQAQDE